MARDVVLVIGVLLSHATAALAVADACMNLAIDNLNHNDYQGYTYQPSHVNWINPDRGFYHKMSTLTSFFMPLTTEGLDCIRNTNGINLLLREYILDTNRNGSDISLDLLNKIEKDLTAARQAGWNLIIRFSYTHKSNRQDTDATEPRLTHVLNHIDQLAVVLNKYPDVITTVQAGFIGRYGDWTDSNQVGPVTDPTQKLDTTQENAFNQTINELLGKMPNITIQIPSPRFKEQLVGSVPSNQGDIVNKSAKIRIGTEFPQESLATGHYSDCLMSKYSAAVDQAAMNYLKDDSMYAVNGGETCHPVDLKNPCAETLQLFKDVHMSFVSTDHSDFIVDLWNKHGCYSQLSSNLGYNLHLNWFVMPKHAVPGESVCFAFNITNYGYAAPFKATDVHLGILNTKTQEVYSAPIDADPRTWIPGKSYLIRGSVTLPANIADNNYTVFLAISRKGAARDDEFILLNTDGIDTDKSINVLPQVNLVVKGTPLQNHNQGTAAVLQRWTLPIQSHHARRIGLPGPASNVDCRSQFVRPTLQPTGSSVVSASATLTHVFPATTPPGTSIPPIATTALSIIAFCHKYALINDIAHEKNLSESSNCYSKVYSSDRIVTTYCNSSNVSQSWKQGPKVMDVCQSLPHYTPIATFTNGMFNTQTNIAGIFLGCTGTGFKVAIALCNKPLSIVHVEVGLPTSSTDIIPDPNPSAYYVVFS